MPSWGVHFGTFEQAAHVATIRLARLPTRVFAGLDEGPGGWRGRIVAARLQVKRLRRVRDARTREAWAACVKWAREDGFDGLIYANAFEGRQPGDSLVVFDVKQIEVLAWSVHSRLDRAE